ncbi:hypothetical protein [Nocardia spumae]|uniref:hypothetical protein n=1 Tax=Nocardia spumae TaxID=2887190 RepID=UPI001D138FCF|nr:hypothetical protein [Nocardia spumae]
MTVIQETVETIGGADNDTMFTFASQLRDSSDGTALITTLGVRVTPQAGVLTTPDLDPGLATVSVGVKSYTIDIPDSDTPVRLWPLIEAGLPVPATQEASAVRNGGGIARAQAMTETAYAAITPDPETAYYLYED